jgi:16S rRNA (guanine527-N7)-methyltransferase
MLLNILNFKINQQQQKQIDHYIDLLLKWNNTFKLTAITNRQQVLDKHILDGLSIVESCQQQIDQFQQKALNSDFHILDLGSGMGIPGVILAIMMPEISITLLDSNSKKTAFLLQVKIELGLHNVRVLHVRAQECHERFNLIVTRAFASCEDILNIAQPLLKQHGVIFAMKSNKAEQELTKLSQNNLNIWTIDMVDLNATVSNSKTPNGIKDQNDITTRYLLKFTVH